jgi:hypothetical protein
MFKEEGNMTEKVRHIMRNKLRLCGSQGNYEPVGTDTKLPICHKCHAIHVAMTGEILTEEVLE